MVAVAALVLLTLSGCGGKSISTAGMVDVEFYGMNGNGSVGTLVINYDKFAAAVETADLSNEDMIKVYDSIKITADKLDGLTNGDVITTAITVDEKIADTYKLKFTTPSEKFTVANLSDAVSLSDMLKIEYRGMDSLGAVKVSLDYEKINSALELLGFSEAETDTIGKEIDIIPSKEQGLSNGDVIVFTVEFDQSTADRVGIKFNTDAGSATVTGLPETMKMSEMFSFSFSGASPELKLEIEKEYDKFNSLLAYSEISDSQKSILQKSLIVTPSKTKEISNGDVIDFTATYDKDIADKMGIKIDKTMEIITVSGEDEYIKSPDQLTEEIINIMNRVVFKHLQANSNKEPEKVNQYFKFVEAFYVNDEVVVPGRYNYSSDCDGIIYVFEHTPADKPNEAILHFVAFQKIHTGQVTEKNLDYIKYEKTENKTTELLGLYKASPSYVPMPVDFSFDDFMG